VAKSFFTEGLFGFRWGKNGLFSKPSTVQFDWKIGDNSKKDSQEGVAGKVNGSKVKCDIKIKL
jgi:hypothetical protein